MNNEMIEFEKKFKINDLKLYETHFWIWSLRPSQATLGAGILSLKRESHVFSELTTEEYIDLGNIVKVIEETLKLLFNYNKINYLMLMMVDKQVHYHVIPRYKDSIILFENKWFDNSWPGIPNLAEEVLEKDQLMKIVSHIKSSIKR